MTTPTTPETTRQRSEHLREIKKCTRPMTKHYWRREAIEPMGRAIEHHAEAMEARIEALEAQVKRFRKALRTADSRVIQYQAEEWTAKHGGVTPSLDWFRRAIGTQESNHYAVDGLLFGDLDDQPKDGSSGEVTS